MPLIISTLARFYPAIRTVFFNPHTFIDRPSSPRLSSHRKHLICTYSPPTTTKIPRHYYYQDKCSCKPCPNVIHKYSQILPGVVQTSCGRVNYCDRGREERQDSCCWVTGFGKFGQVGFAVDAIREVRLVVEKCYVAFSMPIIFCSSTVELIKSHVLSSNHRHAKFAARIFAFCEEKNTICDGVVEVSIGKLVLDDHPDSFSEHRRFIIQSTRRSANSTFGIVSAIRSFHPRCLRAEKRRYNCVSA